MKQPYAWISIAFALGFAQGAFAQSQPAPEPQPAAQKDQAQQQTSQAARESDAAKDAGAQQASEAVDDADSRARTWRHLYGIQVDGVRLSALDKAQVKQLQQALQEQGYYTAKVDGVMGPQTRLALRQYYLDQAELASQDLIMPQSAASLGLDEADIERVRGEEDESERKQSAVERPRGEDSEKDAKNAEPGRESGTERK